MIEENTAFRSVRFERVRQDRKWGEQNHDPLEWLSILGEEVGEACEAANKAHWNNGAWGRYREELAHVAATAIAAIECYDRNGHP